MAKFSEKGGCFTDKFAKLFIEMAKVVKSAIVTDIYNGLISVKQQLTGVIDFDFVQIFKNCEPGGGFEEPAC